MRAAQQGQNHQVFRQNSPAATCTTAAWRIPKAANTTHLLDSGHEDGKVGANGQRHRAQRVQRALTQLLRRPAGGGVQVWQAGASFARCLNATWAHSARQPRPKQPQHGLEGPAARKCKCQLTPSPIQQANERVQHCGRKSRQLHARQQVLHCRQRLLLHTRKGHERRLAA